MINIFDLGKFGAEIELDSSKFDKGMSQAESKTSSFTSKLGGFGKKVGLLAAGAIAGLTAALGGAFAATKKVTDGFDDIAKSSSKLGVSTDAYQELDYWASQNGLSHESMEKAVGRFNQRMGQAQNGNEKYSSALQKLGVNMDDVKNGTLSTEDAFAQSISTLSEMENEQDKVNLATEMFGTRMARDLLPALQDGSLSLEDAKEKAKELGIVIDEDTLSAAEHFNDTWDDLTRSLSAFGQQIIAQLMPVFQSLMDWILDHMPQIQEIFSTVFGFVADAIGWVVEGIQSALEWFGQFGEQTGTILSTVWEGFQTYLELIVELWSGIWETVSEAFTGFAEVIVPFIQEVLETIYQFWSENGEALINSAVETFGTVKETVGTLLGAVFEIIQTILGLILPFIKEQLAKVASFWEENGEAIFKIAQGAFKAIQKIIETVMPIISNVVEVAWGLISGIFDAATSLIMGIIQTFAGLFTGDWSKMWDGIKKIASSLLDAIKTVIKTAFDAIVLVGKTAWNLLTSITKGAWSGIKSLISGIVNGIKNLISKGFNAAKNTVSSIFSGIANIASSIWSGIKNTISSVVSGTLATVKSKFTNLKNNAVNIFNGLKSITTSVWNGVKTAITTPINKAKNTVRDALNKIKGFFTGLKGKLKIKIPKPKLPKFSLSGKFSLTPPSVPKIGLSWHKHGGFFDSPSVIGVGEAGKEAVVPLVGSQMNPFADAVASRMGLHRGSSGGTQQSITLNPTFIYNVENGQFDEKMAKQHTDHLFKYIGKEQRKRGR